MASLGAIPRKCSECQHSFEGECIRAMDLLHRYLDLDHGFCGIPGETDPVDVALPGDPSELEVPRKCSTCSFLRRDSRGAVCSKDADVWGGFPRSLDWGRRVPDVIVPSVQGLTLTLRFARLAAAGDDVQALRAFRQSNPEVSLAIGKQVCEQIRAPLPKLDGPKG